jgi:hypothetical protein
MQLQAVVITYLAFVLRFHFETPRTFCDNSNKTRSLFVLSFWCTLTQGNNTSLNTVRAVLSPSLSTHLSQGQRTTIHNIHINIVCVCVCVCMGGRGVQHADESRWNVCLIHAIVVTVFNNNRIRCPPRNTGCLWALSTSGYQPPRTVVRSSFYPILWWPIFSS